MVLKHSEDDATAEISSNLIEIREGSSLVRRKNCAHAMHHRIASNRLERDRCRAHTALLSAVMRMCRQPAIPALHLSEIPRDDALHTSQRVLQTL
jgi:hypothetical protein